MPPSCWTLISVPGEPQEQASTTESGPTPMQPPADAHDEGPVVVLSPASEGASEKAQIRPVSQSAELVHAVPCWFPGPGVTSAELLSDEQAPRATAAKATNAERAVTSEVFIAAEPTHLAQRCRHAIDTDI